MAKLTLNIHPDVINKGKLYARVKGQSLSAIVENYIKSVAAKEETIKGRNVPPAIKKLSGAIKLSKDFDFKKDLQQHWIKKYS